MCTENKMQNLPANCMLVTIKSWHYSQCCCQDLFKNSRCRPFIFGVEM